MHKVCCSQSLVLLKIVARCLATNKLFKSDSQRVAFSLCVGFSALRWYAGAPILRCSHLNRALCFLGENDGIQARNLCT